MKNKFNLKDISKFTKGNITTYGIVIGFYILMQILIGTGSVSYTIRGNLVPICTYVVLAISLNLTVGVLGELSLGHAGFWCIGAFASAFFSACTIDVFSSSLLRFIFAILVGALCAAVFGILIGIPVLRLRGDYLAIVTLAFGEIIKNFLGVIFVGKDVNGLHFSMKNAASLQMAEDGKLIINGALGITGTPKDSTFTIGMIMVMLTLFIVLNLIKSRAGRAIMAIRDNRIAAESVGINITKYKLMAFAISATLAGAAGGLYSHNLASLTASSKTFGYNMSIMILIFVVLGGNGNIRGSMIAAVMLTLLPDMLRSLNEYRMLIYAILLIAMMLFNWSPKAIEFRKKYSPKRLLAERRERKGRA